MAIPQEKYKKLPEWVKNEIKALEYEIKELNDQVAQINGEQDTDIFIMDMNMNRPLPKKSYIRIMVGKHYIDVYKMKSSTGEEVVRVSADCQIKVMPSASNSCYVGAHDD